MVIKALEWVFKTYKHVLCVSESYACDFWINTIPQTFIRRSLAIPLGAIRVRPSHAKSLLFSKKTPLPSKITTFPPPSSLARSIARSLARSLARAIARSLDRSLARSPSREGAPPNQIPSKLFHFISWERSDGPEFDNFISSERSDGLCVTNFINQKKTNSNIAANAFEDS